MQELTWDSRQAVKKTGREGQQRRLRDESGPLGTPFGVLRSLGTHVAQELPGLAKVLDDAGIGFRGGSGHLGVAPFGEFEYVARTGSQAAQKLLALGFLFVALPTGHDVLLFTRAEAGAIKERIGLEEGKWNIGSATLEPESDANSNKYSG